MYTCFCEPADCKHCVKTTPHDIGKAASPSPSFRVLPAPPTCRSDIHIFFNRNNLRRAAVLAS
jgi:hypothetical protein